jgi:hypothetical protein
MNKVDMDFVLILLLALFVVFALYPMGGALSQLQMEEIRSIGEDCL